MNALTNVIEIGIKFDKLVDSEMQYAFKRSENIKLCQLLDTIYPEPDKNNPEIVARAKLYKELMETDTHPRYNVNHLIVGDRVNTPKKPNTAGVISGIIETIKGNKITLLCNTFYGLQRHVVTKKRLLKGTLFKDGNFYQIDSVTRA